jgi:hypothetical protein
LRVALKLEEVIGKCTNCVAGTYSAQGASSCTSVSLKYFTVYIFSFSNVNLLCISALLVPILLVMPNPAHFAKLTLTLVWELVTTAQLETPTSLLALLAKMTLLLTCLRREVPAHNALRVSIAPIPL